MMSPMTMAAMAVSSLFLMMGSTSLASIVFALCSLALDETTALYVGAGVGLVSLCFFLMDKRILSRPEKPTVVMVPTSDNLKLVNETPSLQESKAPVLALRNPLVSTCYAYLKHSAAPPTKKYVLTSQDGGLFEVDVLLPSTPWNKARQCTKNAHKPPGVLLIYPGVGGHSRDPPPRDMTRQGYEMGWVTCILNHRGVGTVPLCTPKTTTWGDTSDMEATLRFIQVQFPRLPVVAVGFSMGANLVTKFMGTVNEDKSNADLYHSVSGAFCFSNGLYIRLGYEQIKRGRSFLQQLAHKRVLENAKSAYKNAVKSVKTDPVVRKLMESESIWEFDETQMLNLYKEQDFDQAVEKASSGNYLKNVGRPLITLHALDDPCLDGSDEYLQTVKKVSDNPYTIFALTNYGGHTGWYHEVLWSSKSRSDRYKSLCCRMVEEMGPKLIELSVVAAQAS